MTGLKLVLCSNRRIASAALSSVELSMRLASRKYCRYRRLMRSFSSWYFRAVYVHCLPLWFTKARRVPLGQNRDTVSRQARGCEVEEHGGLPLSYSDRVSPD